MFLSCQIGSCPSELPARERHQAAELQETPAATCRMRIGQPWLNWNFFKGYFTLYIILYIILYIYIYHIIYHILCMYIYIYHIYYTGQHTCQNSPTFHHARVTRPSWPPLLQHAQCLLRLRCHVKVTDATISARLSNRFWIFHRKVPWPRSTMPSDLSRWPSLRTPARLDTLQLG